MLGLDLHDFDPVKGAICLSHVDIRQTAEAIGLLRQHLGGRQADLIMSDIAPAATGVSRLDSPSLINLAECVLKVC